jgi:hypothetical protein
MHPSDRRTPGAHLAFRALAILTAISVVRSGRAGAPEDRHRVLPCRPTVSCTADLVPPGSLEIEAGYLARRVPRAGFVHAEPLLLKLTLLDWLQVQAGMNGQVFTTGEVDRSLRYLDDISFGPKVRFWKQTDLRPSFAVSAALSVPSWNRPKEFPYAYDASFWLYLSKDLGRLHLDLNGGLNVWQFDLADVSYQRFVTLASSYSLTDAWGVLLEGYAFSHGGVIAPKDGGVLAGVTYAPMPWLMFDVGGDVGLYPTTRKYSLFAGLTTVVYDFWDTEDELRERAAMRAWHPRTIGIR